MPAPNVPPKQGVRAAQRNALERITGLEESLGQVIQSANNALMGMNQQMRAFGEILDAVVNTLGADVVNVAIEKAREDRALAQAAASQEALKLATEKGQVRVVDILEDDSILTGVEYDKEGVAIKPGYVQIPFSDVLPELKEKIRGQTVGFKFETPAGGSFEVTGVYQPVPEDQWPKEEAPAPEQTVEVQPVPENPVVEAPQA